MRRRPGIDRWNGRLGVWMPRHLPEPLDIQPVAPKPDPQPIRHPVLTSAGNLSILVNRLYRIAGSARVEMELIGACRTEPEAAAIVYREAGRARATNHNGKPIHDNWRDIEVRES